MTAGSNKPTMADQFKARRKADYADAHELFGIVMDIDQHANCLMRDGRAVIMFSDGSEYKMGDNG